MRFTFTAFILQAFLIGAGSAFFTSSGTHQTHSKRVFSSSVHHAFHQNYLQSLGNPPPPEEEEEPVVAVEIEPETAPATNGNSEPSHSRSLRDSYLSALSGSSGSSATPANDVSSALPSAVPPPAPAEYAPVPVPAPRGGEGSYLNALSGSSWSGADGVSTPVTSAVPPPAPVEYAPEPKTRRSAMGSLYLNALSSFGGTGSGVKSYDNMVSYVDSISSQATVASPHPEIHAITVNNPAISPAPETTSSAPSSRGSSYQSYLNSMSAGGSAISPQKTGGMAAYLEAIASASSSVEKTTSDVTPPPNPRSGMISYLDALSAASSIGGAVKAAVPSFKNSIDLELTLKLNDMEVMLAELEESVRKSQEMQDDFEARLAILEKGQS